MSLFLTLSFNCDYQQYSTELVVSRFVFSARQHAKRAICYRPSVRLSVCPSVTRVDQSKTVELTVTQFSPYTTVASAFYG